LPDIGGDIAGGALNFFDLDTLSIIFGVRLETVVYELTTGMDAGATFTNRLNSPKT
jgi:hypothetical protein